MTIATCGHEVENGISIEINDITREGEPCLTYGTYCADCLYDYYKEGRIANLEFYELVGKLLKDNQWLLEK